LSVPGVHTKNANHFPPDEFNNVYEESKCRGENRVGERCSREGIRLGIYRPSIVYGDSRSGKSLSFRGLYYPVRTVLYFKNLYRADMLERGGRVHP
jgi:thioester reductase-like protein